MSKTGCEYLSIKELENLFSSKSDRRVLNFYVLVCLVVLVHRGVAVVVLEHPVVVLLGRRDCAGAGADTWRGAAYYWRKDGRRVFFCVRIDGFQFDVALVLQQLVALLAQLVHIDRKVAQMRSCHRTGRIQRWPAQVRVRMNPGPVLAMLSNWLWAVAKFSITEGNN